MKKAKTLVKEINQLYLELRENYSPKEICEAIENTPNTDWFLENLYDFYDEEDGE